MAIDVGLMGLTLWQPWASMIGWYEKSIETRSWDTDYRGLLAIHASKSVPSGDRWSPGQFGSGLTKSTFDEVLAEHGVFGFEDLTMGAIVAVARLETVVRVRSALHAEMVIKEHGSRYEEVFGNFAIGRHLWILKDVVGLECPIVCGGGRGLWQVPEMYAVAALDEYRRRLPAERPKNRSQAWL